MNKVKVIRNYNDANKLINMGNKILKIDRDKNDRDYFVFIFEYSDKLMCDLKEITPIK